MDQNKYINAYIDSTVGMLHENITQILQLKAQLKVIGDVVAEKDNMINDINNRLSSNQSIEQDYHKLVKRNQELVNEISALNNKVSHIDTFTRQILEMKYMIVEKDIIIEDLTNKLNPNLIKNKKKKSMKTLDVEVEEKSNTSTSNTDDF
jgi:DNA repair ATPase RecN